MTDTPPSPPASWFPNPDGTDTLRYWDGSGWTEHVSVKPVDLPAPPASPEFDPPAPGSTSPAPPSRSIESASSEAAGTTDDRGSSVAPPGSPAAPEPAPTPTGPLRAPITKIAPQASVDGRSPRKPQWAFALIGLVIVLAAAVIVVVFASGSGNNQSQQVAKLIESGGYTGGESNILEANFTALAGASGATCSVSGSLGGRTVYACTWTNDGKTESGRWEFLAAHQPYPAAIGRVSDGGSSGSAPTTAAAATTLVNSVIQQRDPGAGGSASCSGPTKAVVIHADGLTLPGGVGGDYVCELLDNGSPVKVDGQTFTETWRWASDGVVLEDKDGTSAQATTASGNTGNTGDSGNRNGVTPSAGTPELQLDIGGPGESFTGREPTIIYFSGDATNIVGDIHWSEWTADQAVGTGASEILSCMPDCADGKGKSVVAQVVFTDPEAGYFTRVRETRNGTSETGAISGNRASGDWPEGASAGSGNTGSGDLPQMPSKAASEYAARTATSNVAGIGSETCSLGVTISGKNTDCSFADSVEGAYDDAGIGDGTVSATSPDDPSLGSISMRCTVYSGGVVACIGGIDDKAIVFLNGDAGNASSADSGASPTSTSDSCQPGPNSGLKDVTETGMACSEALAAASHLQISGCALGDEVGSPASGSCSGDGFQCTERPASIPGPYTSVVCTGSDRRKLSFTDSA